MSSGIAWMFVRLLDSVTVYWQCAPKPATHFGLDMSIVHWQHMRACRCSSSGILPVQVNEATSKLCCQHISINSGILWVTPKPMP